MAATVCKSPRLLCCSPGRLSLHVGPALGDRRGTPLGLSAPPNQACSPPPAALLSYLVPFAGENAVPGLGEGEGVEVGA